jgi:CAAX protease family protein
MKEIAPVRSRLKAVFVSPSEPRLRAGWRLLIQVLMQLGLGFCFGLLLLVVYGMFSGMPADLSGVAFLEFNQVVEFVTITGSILLARRFLDKRSFASLGLALDRSALRDVLAGIGITLLMMGLIFIAESAAGWLTVSSIAWNTEALPNVALQSALFLIVFIFVGWNEELMSRGYHLQTIASGLNLIWGLVISSAVFGVLHLGNPHATWVSTVGIFGAGLFLGYAYLRTRQLWLSIGLHIGWNYFEAVVFGFPVSGLQTYHLLRTDIRGPELWTGGPFGPEAGLILLPALLIGTILIYIYTRKSPAV